ncbi:MAG: ribosome silencing factor [Brevinematia bacterium]
MRRQKTVSKRLINKIAKVLSHKKAEDIKIIDTSKITSEFEYMIIATGNNKFHIESLVDELEKFIKENNILVLARDINPESGWVVLDLLHTIIHIMTPDVRNYYNLERIWELPKQVKLETKP